MTSDYYAKIAEAQRQAEIERQRQIEQAKSKAASQQQQEAVAAQAKVQADMAAARILAEARAKLTPPPPVVKPPSAPTLPSSIAYGEALAGGARAQEIITQIRVNPADTVLSTDSIQRFNFESKKQLFKLAGKEYTPDIQQRDIQQNYYRVGGPYNPEYISKAQYNEIMKWATDNKLNVEWIKEVLHTGGIARLNILLRERGQEQLSEQIRAFRKNYVNTEDYPANIQAMYYEGVKSGDLSAFNTASRAWFEKKVINAEDYPSELRKKYYEGKEKGDFTAYNAAANSYNRSMETAQGMADEFTDKENKYYDKQLKEYEVQLKDFEKWINTEAPKELKDAYDKGGMKAYETAAANYYGDYEAALKEVGPYISTGLTGIKSEADAEKIADAAAKATKGETGALASSNKSTLYETSESEVSGIPSSGETIDIVSYLRDGKDEKWLKALGVTDDDILQTRKYIAYEDGWSKFTSDYFKKRGWSVELPSIDPRNPASEKELDDFEDHIKEANGEYYKLLPEKKPQNIAKEVALGMIPVYGTIRYYGQAKEGGLDTKEKVLLAVSVAGDILTVIPAVGQVSAAARGTFMAGKAGQFISKGVQLREFGKAVGGYALAEIRAPFTAIAHPIETAKSGLGSIETALRPNKIPLSAIETKFNTMRIPVSMVGGNPQTAMALRNAVTASMVQGKEARAVVNGWEVRLNPNAMNQIGEPVAFTATPDIRPFLEGATIGDTGRDLYLAPTFHSRFSLSTSGGRTTEGGINGGLIIRDPVILKELESSGKLYAGTAEIESIIKASKKIKLGKPSQVLVSRTPAGKKLTLLVFGKPYSTAEIANLKLMGSLDTISQIFQSPVRVGKKGSKLIAVGGGSIPSGGRYSSPLRMGVVNTTPRAGFIDRYRQLTGDTRRNIVLKDYDERRGVKRRANRTAPRVVVRRPPSAKARRAVVELRRVMASPMERRTPPREPVRGTLRIPERATPIEPPRRVPPLPPERRVPPTTPERTPPRVPPESTPPRVPPPVPPERVPPKPPPTRVPPRVPLRSTPPAQEPPDKDDSDDKKQEFLSKVEGVVAHRRGMLNGKPLYLIDYYPYGPKDKMVMHEPPRGVKEASGPGSAQASATLLRGIPPSKSIFWNTGAVDDVINAQGKNIKVTSVQDKALRLFKVVKPKKFKFREPRMVDSGDGIVYNPTTGKGHLKI